MKSIFSACLAALRDLTEPGVAITEQRYVPGVTTPTDMLMRRIGESVTVVTAKGDVTGVLRAVDDSSLVVEIGAGDQKRLSVMRRDGFVQDVRVASGPGLVAAAFSVDRTCTGLDLCDPASPLHLEPPPPGARPVATVAGPRIGVAYAGEPWAALPYRLFDGSSPSVSRVGRRSDPGRTG